MLTGGGDCPGLNPVIRAVCRRLWESGHETVGVLNGWRGMIDGDLKPLGFDEISGILPRGGTIIGTSRTNPHKIEGGVEGVQRTFEQLDALVAIGGEDTLGVAAKLHGELGLPIVGVPKTIDNDLNGTDYTFGFDTAVHVATEAIDRVHSTAESHNRVIVVETMGRHAGWIALMSGIAGGADFILIPEQAGRLGRRRRGRRAAPDARKELLGHRRKRGLRAARRRDEGEVDEFGHVRVENRNVGDTVAAEVEARTGMQARATVLGYIQRGGTPTARDRVLGLRFGLKAADLVVAGRFGGMAALHGDEVLSVPLEEATAELKLVPDELVRGREDLLRLILRRPPHPDPDGGAATPGDGLRRSARALARTPLPLLLGWIGLGYGLSRLSTRVVDWYVMTDELLYERLALSVVQGGSPLPRVHGALVPNVNQLYPLLLSSVYWRGSIPAALHDAHLLNAFLMSSAALPAALLAQRTTGSRPVAYLVGLATVCVPWIVYSSFLLTEVVGYPAFLWALLALQATIVAPSRRRDALALGGLVAGGARPHAIRRPRAGRADRRARLRARARARRRHARAGARAGRWSATGCSALPTPCSSSAARCCSSPVAAAHCWAPTPTRSPATCCRTASAAHCSPISPCSRSRSACCRSCWPPPGWSAPCCALSARSASPSRS